MNPPRRITLRLPVLVTVELTADRSALDVARSLCADVYLFDSTVGGVRVIDCAVAPSDVTVVDP